MLWSAISKAAIIIIPEEAEDMIPLIRSLKQAPTHLLMYAAPVTRKMVHLSELSYYSVPALPRDWTAPTSLKIEIAILAGALYFPYEDYAPLCAYLGIETTSNRDKATRPSSAQDQTFTAKPLAFLQDWLAVRRKGQDFTHTPMGWVCQGKKLAANHPFFSDGSPDISGAAVPAGPYEGGRSTGEEEMEEEEEDDDDDEGADEGEEEVDGVDIETLSITEEV